MIKVSEFYDELKRHKTNFFCGVPDSLLKSFCAYIKDNSTKGNYIVTANEGNAIAMAAGHYLSTGNIASVFMQNSGLGNAVNPLASLTDELVYSIPVLLIVGWRGQPGLKDEPQHKKQGIITLGQLELLGIQYKVIDKNMSEEQMRFEVNKAYDHMNQNKKSYALVIEKTVFENYKLMNIPNDKFEMKRERAIEVILSNMNDNSAVISTTGMASRELFELREKYNENHEKDFLTVGSMGHASSIALEIALEKSDKDIYCIDGDGALLMHLGSLAIVGSLKPKNFKHIVINNGAHDSVGGQETVGLNIDILKIAKACGYVECYSCSTESELIKYCERINNLNGPILLEVKVNKGARKDLGRPTISPLQNKKNFMSYLKSK